VPRDTRAGLNFDGVGAGFILAELDLAITFCEIGLTTRSLRTAQRNAEHARRTLDAVSAIENRVTLTSKERDAISSKTSHLLSSLGNLEDHLQERKAADSQV
jgi:hypothetical protein